MHSIKPLVFLIIIGSLILFSIYSMPRVKQAEPFQKIPKLERIKGMADQEFEMTKDPMLNEIPTHRLHKAIKQINHTNSNRNFDLNWEERGPDNFAGRVRAICFDDKDPSGNTIWAGGIAGGLWKCTNAFSNHQWTEIKSFFGNVAVSTIIQDPTNSDVFYLGTGEGFYNADAYRGDGIYKSLDGGDSWSKMESTNHPDFNYIQKLMLSEGRIFACTRTGGIQISDDGGETWVKSLGNGTYGFSERASDIELASDGTIYASMGIFGEDGIYKSTDNGGSWAFLPFPFSGYERVEIATAPSNPNVVYALPQENDSSGVKFFVKSLDAGISWDTLPTPEAFGMDNFARNQAWYDLSIGVDPNNENRVFIGGVDLHLTEDGGNTFTQLSQWYGADNFQYVHADQHNLLFLESDPNKIMFSNDGGIWLTANGNTSLPSISNINKGLNITQFYACSVHPSPDIDWIIGGTQDNGTHLLTSSGTNASERILGGDGCFTHIDKDNPDIQIGSYVYNNYRVTLDGWETVEYYNADHSEGYFVNPTDYDDVNDKLYCSAEGGSMNVLDVYTGIFDSIHLDVINSERLTAIKVNPFNANLVIIGTNNGRVYQIENLLTTPEVTQIFSSGGSVRNIEFDPADELRMIVTYANYGVNSIFYTEDGASTWENIEGNLPDMPVWWAIFNPSNPDGLIMGTELSVWSTDNINGANTQWSLNSENMPLTRVDMLDLRAADNFLVAATHGRGIYSSGSLSDLTAYFNVANYQVTDGFGVMENLTCPRYFLDSVALKLNKPADVDLTFTISLNSGGTALEFIDFELLTSELDFPTGELEQMVYFRIYENMVEKGPRFFELSASSSSLDLGDIAKITIEDDEETTEELFIFVKKSTTEPLSSIINPLDSAIYSTTDSLVFSLISNESNTSDCFEASIIYSGSQLLEENEYFCSNKIVYLENENTDNQYIAKILLSDDDADLLENKSNDFAVLYTPELLTEFDQIPWVQYEAVVIEDIGYKKNEVQFEYKGPGSYAIGISDVTKVKEDLLSDIKIFPNPASIELHASCESCSIERLELYNMNGKLLSKSADTKMSLTNITDGMYIIKIFSVEGTKTEKIIISK